MKNQTIDPNDIQGTSARTINLSVGAIALLIGPGLVLLGLISRLFLGAHLDWFAAPSISEYYEFNDFTRNCFVGAMFAIGVLLSAYRGWHQNNIWDRTIAALSWAMAWLVALVPCNSPYFRIHFGAAAILFVMMAAMLWFRFTEATGDSDEQRDPAWKNLRNRVYRICAVIILVAIFFKLLSFIPALRFDIYSPWNFTFWIEVIGLSAFSIGWLTKSRFILGYKRQDGWLHRGGAPEFLAGERTHA